MHAHGIPPCQRVQSMWTKGCLLLLLNDPHSCSLQRWLISLQPDIGCIRSSLIALSWIRTSTQTYLVLIHPTKLENKISWKAIGAATATVHKTLQKIKYHLSLFQRIMQQSSYDSYGSQNVIHITQYFLFFLVCLKFHQQWREKKSCNLFANKVALHML